MTAPAPSPQTVNRVGGRLASFESAWVKHFSSDLCLENNRRVQDTLRASSSRLSSLSRFILSLKRFEKSGDNRQGNRSIFYLNDILIMASTKEGCEAFVRETLNLLQELGFVINSPKSSLVPAQSFKFLGLVWNTVSGMVNIDDQK